MAEVILLLYLCKSNSKNYFPLYSILIRFYKIYIYFVYIIGWRTPPHDILCVYVGGVYIIYWIGGYIVFINMNCSEMFVFLATILIVYISHNMAISSNFMRSGNCKHSSLQRSAGGTS